MTAVRIIARLGTLAAPNDARFVDEVVEPGTVGELVPFEDTPPLPQGWRLVRVELGELVRYVPAHPHHYEENTDA